MTITLTIGDVVRWGVVILVWSFIICDLTSSPYVDEERVTFTDREVQELEDLEVKFMNINRSEYLRLRTLLKKEYEFTRVHINGN